MTICFIKGNLAIINDWLVQLDRDYLNTIQNLLTNLSDTGSHFESLEEEAQLKSNIIKKVVFILILLTLFLKMEKLFMKYQV